MEWKSSYIVYRMDSEKNFNEVFYADDLAKAKYWLTYIGEVGDVLTKTPAHPKNTSGLPEYWSHKSGSGQTSTDKEKLLKQLSVSEIDSIMPKEQVGQ